MSSALDKVSPDSLADQSMKFAAAGAACVALLVFYFALPRFQMGFSLLRLLPRNVLLLAILCAPIMAIAGIRRSSRALRFGTSKRGKAIAATLLSAATLTIGTVGIGFIVTLVYMFSRSNFTF